MPIPRRNTSFLTLSNSSHRSWTFYSSNRWPVLFPGIVVLSQHAPHQLIQHCHVEKEGSPGHRWHKYQGVHEALFDSSNCLLTVIVPANGLILVKELEERLVGSCELWYEPGDVVQTSQETLDLFLGMWLQNLKDGFYFLGANLYPFLTHDEAQQFPWLDPESTLDGVQP